MKREPTSTELMVFSMITENTGRHFLDSGGAYGRHWERNQKIPIEAWIKSDKVTMRPSVVRGNDGWLDVTLSLFHHLVDNLDYDEYTDKLFHRFVNMYEESFYYSNEWSNRNFSWEKAMKAFHDLITKDRKGNRQYNSWEFDDDNFSGYTYNNDNILSQDFVYYVFGAYAFIQTHNGCDARGGFSWPHLFRLNDKYSLLDYDSYTITCNNKDESHWWDYRGGYEESETDVELSKCEWVDFDMLDENDLDTLQEEQEAYRLALASWENQIPLDGFDNPKPTPPSVTIFAGKIVVRDGEAHCPICGSKLFASSF